MVRGYTQAQKMLSQTLREFQRLHRRPGVGTTAANVAAEAPGPFPAVAAPTVPAPKPAPASAASVASRPVGRAVDFDLLPERSAESVVPVFASRPIVDLRWPRRLYGAIARTG